MVLSKRAAALQKQLLVTSADRADWAKHHGRPNGGWTENNIPAPILLPSCSLFQLLQLPAAQHSKATRNDTWPGLDGCMARGALLAEGASADLLPDLSGRNDYVHEGNSLSFWGSYGKRRHTKVPRKLISSTKPEKANHGSRFSMALLGRLGRFLTGCSLATSRGVNKALCPSSNKGFDV